MPGGNQQAVLNASQLSVDDGLTITAKQNTSGVDQGDYPWISGIINTMGKFTLPETRLVCADQGLAARLDYFGPAGQQASEQDVSDKIPSITDMSGGYHTFGSPPRCA